MTYASTMPPRGAGGPVGIRGWLILPAIGLVLLPIQSILFILEINRTLPLVNLVGQSDLSMLFYAEIIIQAAIFLFGIYIAFQFFRRKQSTPKLFVLWLWVRALFVLVDAALVAVVLELPFDPESTRDIIMAIIIAVIWSLYWTRSVRVENTFTVP